MHSTWTSINQWQPAVSPVFLLLGMFEGVFYRRGVEQGCLENANSLGTQRSAVSQLVLLSGWQLWNWPLGSSRPSCILSPSGLKGLEFIHLPIPPPQQPVAQGSLPTAPHCAPSTSKQQTCHSPGYPRAWGENGPSSASAACGSPVQGNGDQTSEWRPEPCASEWRPFLDPPWVISWKPEISSSTAIKMQSSLANSFQNT